MTVLEKATLSDHDEASSCPTCQFIQQLISPECSSSSVTDDANDEDDETATTTIHTITTSLPSFRVTDWDDGHIPEGFQAPSLKRPERDLHHHAAHGCGGSTTRMVHYDRPQPAVGTPPVVHVLDHVVPMSLVDALYDWTVSLDRPWGTYVTMEQVQRFFHDNDDNKNENANHQHPDYKYQNLSQDDLALHAVASFCRNGLTSSIPSSIHTTNESEMNSSSTKTPIVSWPQLLQEGHGVAIWALASLVGSQVPYHLDYAEQIRYDTNVICPPLYAGTLQCSKTQVHHSCGDNDKDTADGNGMIADSTTVMKGGDFWVNVQGLDHYRQYGYKGALVSKTKDKRHATADDEDDETVDWLPPNIVTDSSGWVRIPFSYNRIICHKGDLPHCSTKVEALPPNTMRVIVGFNVFPRIVGERVQQAPEHSNAFRRKVQLRRFWLLQQAKLSTTGRIPRDDGNIKNDIVQDASQKQKRPEKVFTLNMIQSNKGLTKLFVLAKRQRIQYLFRQAQAKLEKDILQLVWQRQDKPARQPTTVAFLMQQLGRTPTSSACQLLEQTTDENEENVVEPNKQEDIDLLGWPTPLDVQVQVHHMLLESTKSYSSEQSDDNPRCKLMRWTSQPQDKEENGKKKPLVSPPTLVYAVVKSQVNIGNNMDTSPRKQLMNLLLEASREG
jgi:hypothetical protein